MKKLGLLVIVLLGLFFVQIVSAEVLFSTTDDLYNRGDTLIVSATIEPTISGEDYLEMFLVCGNSTREDFHKEFVMIEPGDFKEINVRLLLTSGVIGDLSGDCFVEGFYGADFGRSQNFRISDDLIVSFELDKLDFEPEEKVIVYGFAKRSTLDYAEGFAEVYFNSEMAGNGLVEDGEFEVSFKLSHDVAPGTYNISALVYEKDSKGAMTNNGTASMDFNVLQVPRAIKIEMDKSEIIPGETIEFKTSLLDQVGSNMDGEFYYVVLDDLDYIVEDNISVIGAPVRVETFSFEMPALWTIEVYHENLSNSRVIKILENEEAKFTLANETVIAENVGNVVYNKTVSFVIGNETVEKAIYLKLGQAKKFYLEAPDGNYDVRIDDGKNSVSNSGMFLTGKAIDISDKKGLVRAVTTNWFIWVFVLIILIMIALIIWLKVRKKSFKIMKPNFAKFKKTSLEPVKDFKKDFTGDLYSPTAISTLVSDGNKQIVTLVTLKIKNNDELRAKKDVIKLINHMVDLAVGHTKAVTYSSEDYIFLIFAPAITKTFDNEVPAIKAASKLTKEIEDYNKKSSDKIEFGISVNSGNILAKKEEGKLKFTSIGNTVAVGKKIAQISNRVVMLSPQVHSKTIPGIKSVKSAKSSSDFPVFEVKEFVDRNKNKGFLDSFVKRNYKQKV